MAAQFIEERTLSHPGRGRSFIQEGEDAVQGGTQSSSGQGERCPVRRRTLSSLAGRTLSKEDAVQSGKEKTLFEGQKDADQA